MEGSDPWHLDMNQVTMWKWQPANELPSNDEHDLMVQIHVLRHSRTNHLKRPSPKKQGTPLPLHLCSLQSLPSVALYSWL